MSNDIDLAAIASAWRDHEPDPANRTEIDQLTAGDPDELAARFSGRLHFGTAGLRAALGAGPARMNAIVVAQAAAGVAGSIDPDGLVVIGYDARHRSKNFAEVSAAVCSRAGHRVVLIDGPVPTPVLVWAAQSRSASAAVMVTASHNPATDNGYKVYAVDGAQVDARMAASIEERIEATPVTPPTFEPDDSRIEVLSAAATIADYLDLLQIVPSSTSFNVVYTPLHGVGADTAVAALEAAGHRVSVVESQGEPDPDFPTAPFPNPEEPGTLDPALALATGIGADVIVANDPDADRLAVAIPEGDGWRRLTGDELGSLLGDHLLAAGSGAQPRLVASSVVSSPLLAQIAESHGAAHHQTLTGFKHLARAADDTDGNFVFAYEEAYGYSVDPRLRDKDGIAAAVAFLDLMARARDRGASVADLLQDLDQRFGAHRSGQVSVRYGGDAALTAMAEAMAGHRAEAPAALGGLALAGVEDLAQGRRLPPTNGLIWLFAGEGATDGLDTVRGRVVIRPSGTEPKLKVYVQVRSSDAAVADSHLADLIADCEQLFQPDT